MENQKKNSGELFSFPELDLSSPDSPFNDPNKNNDSSPADRLFFNGRLLPHVFPIQDNNNNTNYYYYYGTTRRSSSVSSSSKDSLMSLSPSASTNSSRSSSCSSARTSSSDNSERKLFHSNYPNRIIPSKATSTIATSSTRERNYHGRNRHVLLSSTTTTTQPYGSSKRWQFITPAPALKPEFPLRRKKVAIEVAAKHHDLRTKKQVKEKTSKKSWFWGRRFFRAFLFACRQCHAMAPSTRKDVLQTRTKLQKI